MSTKEFIITAVTVTVAIVGAILFCIGSISENYGLADAGIVTALFSAVSASIENFIGERRAR